MSESQQFSFTLEQQEDFAFLIRFDKDIPPLLADEPPPLGHDAGPNPSRLLAASIAKAFRPACCSRCASSRTIPARSPRWSPRTWSATRKSACASAASM